MNISQVKLLELTPASCVSVVFSGVLYRFKLVLPSLLFLFPIYRVTQRVTTS